MTSAEAGLNKEKQIKKIFAQIAKVPNPNPASPSSGPAQSYCFPVTVEKDFNQATRQMVITQISGSSFLIGML
jgi:hypothetical protein